MNTIDNFKLKAELLALKARLKGEEIYGDVSRDVENLATRLRSDENEGARSEEKNDWGKQLDTLSEKIKEKSSDVIEYIDSFVDRLEQKMKS